MTLSMSLFGANFLTWAEFIGGVIIVIIYVFNHLITVAGKQQQRRPVRPEGRPDQRGPRPVGKPDAQDEVADFLRRAAEKRSAAKTGEGRPIQSATVPERVDPRIAEMRSAAQKRQAANRSTASVPAEIIEPRSVEPLASSRWPNPVQSHVDTRELAERVGHLTHVDRAEAAFQAHMQSLDHPVGRIADVTAGQPAPATGASPTSTAPALSDFFASLLADPQNLRQAIILNEIIERPVERW